MNEDRPMQFVPLRLRIGIIAALIVLGFVTWWANRK